MSDLPPEFSEKFGDALKKARKARNVRQITLAQDLSVSDTYISRWEKGVLYPTLGQLFELKKALSLTEQQFEELYLPWKREADAIPLAYVRLGERPEELVLFIDKSIAFARQLRKTGQPRLAMNLCERDVAYVFGRVRKLPWSSTNLHVLGRISELLLEQCKAGLDFLSRGDVKNGAMAEVLQRLGVIERACKNEITHFYAELALEGTTYVSGDVTQAFVQSMKLVDNLDDVPVRWRPEVLRANAINAGKLMNRDALQRVEALIEELFNETGGKVANGEQAFVLEGLARGWTRLDPERAQGTIERAWITKSSAPDTKSESLLRHVQLIRTEAEIVAADREGADVVSIVKKIRDGLRVSEDNGYDRYTDQFKGLLQRFD